MIELQENKLNLLEIDLKIKLYKQNNIHELIRKNIIRGTSWITIYRLLITSRNWQLSYKH